MNKSVILFWKLYRYRLAKMILPLMLNSSFPSIKYYIFIQHKNVESASIIIFVTSYNKDSIIFKNYMTEIAVKWALLFSELKSLKPEEWPNIVHEEPLKQKPGLTNLKQIFVELSGINRNEIICLTFFSEKYLYKI